MTMNTEYKVEDPEGVPSLCADVVTYPQWHVNVLYSGSLEKDVPFTYVVFAPNRDHYLGDTRRGEGRDIVVLPSKTGTLPSDVLDHVQKIVDEYVVVLEGMGKGLA